MRRAAFIALLVCCLFSPGRAQQQSVTTSPVAQHPAAPQRAGFHLIVAEADSAKGLPPAGPGQVVVRYDYRLLRDSERETPKYLLMSKSADVPLILATAPELRDKGENGNPELRLALTPESATMLEKVTREHLGGKVAFVIDGEPVTIHKIRSPITGGQFRLSRCTDTACQYIYGRLVDQK